MKVAILFSGQLRNSIPFMKMNVDFFANQPDVEQVDTYIHAWWDKDQIGKYIGMGILIQEEDPSSSIEEILKPKKYKLEKQIDVDLSEIPPYRPGIDKVPSSLHHAISFFGPFSQMASFRKGFELIEDPMSYDIIIRMRTDLSPLNKEFLFPIEDFSIPGAIFTTDGKYIDGFHWGDWFYAGSPAAMKALSENFEANFRRWIKETGRRGDTYEHIKACIVLSRLQHINCNLYFKIERDHYLTREPEKDETAYPFWIQNIKGYKTDL